MSKVGISETILRDAHQSLIATRMPINDMQDLLHDLDQVGFASCEVWGGATFDSCLRFLNEDPWERLRIIRKAMPNTKLSMLFRGQNMLGYRHYADDVVEKFVQTSVKNGIDIIRVFDALNDIRNLETSIRAAKKCNVHLQGAMSYTTGECFDIKYYVDYALALELQGVDSICVKDMAGLLQPFDAYELIKALKANVKVPIQLHSHYTSGLASMTMLKAIEAGVDIIDTAMSPLALGTSHPATETMVAALQSTPYDTGIDLVKLNKIRTKVQVLREKYLSEGLLNPKVLGVDVNTLVYQVPGGMLSNLVSQLTKAKKLHLLEEVLQEVPRVRKDCGLPPLVTPSSQIVGTQAVLNIINQERYKMVTQEFKGILRGEYGQTPYPIDDQFRKSILSETDQIITCRPADLLVSEFETLRQECAEYVTSDEDILSYAQFKEVALQFFKKRDQMQDQVEQIIVSGKFV